MILYMLLIINQQKNAWLKIESQYNVKGCFKLVHISDPHLSDFSESNHYSYPINLIQSVKFANQADLNINAMVATGDLYPIIKIKTLPLSIYGHSRNTSIAITIYHPIFAQAITTQILLIHLFLHISQLLKSIKISFMICNKKGSHITWKPSKITLYNTLSNNNYTTDKNSFPIR